MNRLRIILFLFLLFLLEGTILQVIIPHSMRSEYWIAPHLTLIAVIYVSMYLGSREGLIFGLSVGLLYDLVIGDVLGVFLFAYGLIAYAAGLLIHIFHRTILLLTIAIFLASIALDLFHFGLYWLFQYASMPFSFVFYRQILPSGILTMCIGLILYPILHKLLIELSRAKESSEGGL